MFPLRQVISRIRIYFGSWRSSKKKAFLSQLPRRNVVFLKLDLVSFGISSCSNRRKIPAVTRACLCLPGERKNKNACSCRLVEAALAEDAEVSVLNSIRCGNGTVLHLIFHLQFKIYVSYIYIYLYHLVSVIRFSY